jgi:hypothetical protein
MSLKKRNLGRTGGHQYSLSDATFFQRGVTFTGDRIRQGSTAGPPQIPGLGLLWTQGTPMMSTWARDHEVWDVRLLRRLRGLSRPNASISESTRMTRGGHVGPDG